MAEARRVPLRPPGIVPVAFDGDGTLTVASSIGHSSAALCRYDTERMALGERLAEHPYAPLSQVVYDARERKVVGVRYDDGKPCRRNDRPRQRHERR